MVWWDHIWLCGLESNCQVRPTLGNLVINTN